MVELCYMYDWIKTFLHWRNDIAKMRCCLCSRSTQEAYTCKLCQNSACGECLSAYLLKHSMFVRCFSDQCTFRISPILALSEFGREWYDGTYFPHIYSEILKEQMTLKQETMDAIERMKTASPLEVIQIKQSITRGKPEWMNISDATERFKSCNELIGLIQYRVPAHIREKAERLCSYACTFHRLSASRSWSDIQAELRELRMAYFSAQITADVWATKTIDASIRASLLEIRIVQLQALGEGVYDIILKVLKCLRDSDLAKYSHIKYLSHEMDEQTQELMNSLVCDIIGLLFESVESHRIAFNNLCTVKGYGFENFVQIIDEEWSC